MKKSNQFIYEFNSNLYINLTNKCCNDCEFCLRRNGDGVAQNDTLWLKREPTAQEVIELIKNADFPYGQAVFCGYGESTYKLDEMLRIADYLKSINIKTRLNTNGLGNLINGKNIVPSLKGRIDVVSVSLNEASAKKYDDICHSVYGVDAYPAIIEFARLCVENGIRTVLTVVDVISDEDIKICGQTAAKIGAEFRVRKHIKNNTSYT